MQKFDVRQLLSLKRTECKRTGIKQTKYFDSVDKHYHNPIHSFTTKKSYPSWTTSKSYQQGTQKVCLHLQGCQETKEAWVSLPIAHFYRGEIITGNKQAILERGYSIQKYFKRLIFCPPTPSLCILLQWRSTYQADEGSKPNHSSTVRMEELVNSEVHRIMLTP